MKRYVVLKPKYVLRGWTDMPYCLLDLSASWSAANKAIPLTRMQFDAINMATSQHTSIDDKLLLRSIRKNAEYLLEKGVFMECTEGQGLSEFQKYRLSQARKTYLLTWSITSACNLHCRHCYISCGENIGADVEMDQCREVIRQMLDANIYDVALSGGEPFVHRHFWQLIDMFRENNITVSQIFTNGMALTEKTVSRMVETGIGKEEMLVSFDGVGNHDWMRGLVGAEKQAIKAIKLLKEHGFHVLVATCLHGGCLDAALPTYELLKELHVDHWRLGVPMDAGSWLKNSPQPVDEKELLDTYIKVLKKYKADGCPMTIKLGAACYCEKGHNNYYIPAMCGCGSAEMEGHTLCEQVRLNPYLMANGKLLPCLPMGDSPMEKIAVNIFDEGWDISRALNESPVESYISCTYKDLFEHNPECGRCPHRYICTSCRASAMSYGDGFFGRDKATCYFLNSDYPKYIREIMEMK